MKYGHYDKKSGVELNRDVSSPQFADPGDLRYNYWIEIFGSVFLEQEDPRILAMEAQALSKRLAKVAKFLKTRARRS